ncbi:GLOBIN domain-containing protein [Meloidogyne graminicola]|uniref:GLOBIN domain-containing protein n=1 Tax=Meloidogyne graminicola TaxID=189291 RepID=A0A8S9ZZ62_9BILA|nr:GLOBIN domain-containing protein [Meloidogyne graminicola]
MGNKQNGGHINSLENNSINKSNILQNSSKFLSKSNNNNNNLSNNISINNQRINRRRSEFQQSGKKPDNVSNSNNNNNGNILIINEVGEQTGEINERITRQNRARRWSSVVTVSKCNGKPKRLSPRQCHLVIKSWNKRTPKSRVIKDIFAAIFREAEELKSAFGVEQNVSGRRLRTDLNFVSHTNLFADTLDFVVRNLDDFSLVTENAEQLGRRHATFPLENGFKPEYWNIFAECIIEGISAGEECKETLFAWRQLVQTVIYYMRLGYDRETLRISRHSSFRRSYSPSRSAQIQQQQSFEQQNQQKSSRLTPISSFAIEETQRQRQQNLLDEKRRNSYTTRMPTTLPPTSTNENKRTNLLRRLNN